VIAHKADYYRLLLSVTRDQAWGPWLLFMLQAVADTSKWTTGKIAAICALAEHTTEHVRTRLPKIYTRELVDVIFEQPYCRIGNLVDKGIAQRQAASRYLHDLTALGVLREMPFGKEKLFIHVELPQYTLPSAPGLCHRRAGGLGHAAGGDSCALLERRHAGRAGAGYAAGCAAVLAAGAGGVGGAGGVEPGGAGGSAGGVAGGLMSAPARAVSASGKWRHLADISTNNAIAINQKSVQIFKSQASPPAKHLT
jgi:hypothetical protein